MSTVTAITPNIGAVGDSVTITGTGFGASQGGSTVSFGGVAVASYTSWSDTSIVVVVPAATASARIVVTVSGNPQSGYSASWFEVVDATQRAATDLKGQDETNDSSPESYITADARDYNNLLHLFHNSLDVSRNDFRLSLTSGLAVTTSDVTGATTIYLTSYKGNRIALPATSTASVWAVFESAEVSLALGTLTADKNYDVFAYWSGSAVVLEALAWSSDTARATALVRTKGVYLKTGALTRRYIGTFRTTSTTTTEDSLAKRFVWNAANRVPRAVSRTETTASWTYTTATFRQARASTSNQVAYVAGLAEDAVAVSLDVSMENSGTAAVVLSGIGVDSTSAASGSTGRVPLLTALTIQMSHSEYVGAAQLGYHYLAWLEYSTASGTTTWYGSSAANAGGILQGTVMA